MRNQAGDYRSYSKYLQHYPNKSLAIKDYRLDTGAGLSEAKDVMDIVFARYEATGEKVQRPPKFANSNRDNRTVNSNGNSNHTGAKWGCCLFAIFYLLFAPIIKLAKKYD